MTAAPAAAEPRCSEQEISATGAPGRIHFSARRNARLAWSAKVRAELGKGYATWDGRPVATSTAHSPNGDTAAAPQPAHADRLFRQAIARDTKRGRYDRWPQRRGPLTKQQHSSGEQLQWLKSCSSPAPAAASAPRRPGWPPSAAMTSRSTTRATKPRLTASSPTSARKAARRSPSRPTWQARRHRAPVQDRRCGVRRP